MNREADILRCNILLAQAATVQDRDSRIQSYGKAVLAAKDFLLYYPSDTIAWKLLGQSREGEENIADALLAYSQAVVSDKTSADAQQTFLARGNLYLNQRNYELAYKDFDAAITISDIPEARRGRLSASIGLKNYTAASDDAAALLKANSTDISL